MDMRRESNRFDDAGSTSGSTNSFQQTIFEI